MTNLERVVGRVMEFMAQKYAIGVQQLICRPLFTPDLVRTGSEGLSVEGEKAIILTGVRWATGLKVKVYKGSVLSGYCIAWLSSDVPLISGYPVLLPGKPNSYVLEGDTLYEHDSDIVWDFSGYVVERMGETITPDVFG